MGAICHLSVIGKLANRRNLAVQPGLQDLYLGQVLDVMWSVVHQLAQPHSSQPLY